MAPVKLSSFLKETIKLQRASIPESVKTQIEVIDSDLTVKCDVNQMQQVMMNLINNAFDALAGVEQPSITIQLDRFEADADFIEKHEVSRHEAGYAHISVADNGSGIKEEDIEHLFEPFFTTKAPDKGTGLGLAMVYGFVQNHQGVIDIVTSTKGERGTTVHIYLPLVEESAVAEEMDSEQVDMHGSETILMVDDNEIVLNTAHKVLESVGYRVINASDGEDALKKYRELRNEIDLVILDLVMPRMNGVETLKCLKEINPSVRVIFSTGYDKESILDGLEDIEVISKPFSVASLSAAIHRVLAQQT